MCCFYGYWQKVTAVLVFQVTVWQQMTLLSTLYAPKSQVVYLDFIVSGSESRICFVSLSPAHCGAD